MSILLTIPDSIADAMRLPPDDRATQVGRELAVALYARRILSFGKARELAAMDAYDFGRLLGERGIARHYGDNDLQDDFVYARGE